MIGKQRDGNDVQNVPAERQRQDEDRHGPKLHNAPSIV